MPPRETIKPLRSSEILNGRKLEELSPSEMNSFLSSLPRTKRIEEDSYIGFDFFRRVLARWGLPATVALVKKVEHVNDTDSDFSRHDLEDTPGDREFDRVGFKLSRRDLLRTAGYVPFALAEIGHSSLQIADGIARSVIPKSQGEKQKPSVFGKAAEAVETYAIPPAGVLLGAALLTDAHHNWREMKLEHIANAAGEIAEVAELQKNPLLDK